MSATGVATKTTTMRAAVLEAPGRVRMAQLPVPEPGTEQVLVRLEGCGVCGSNVPVWEGRPWFEYPLQPGAPGHEAWGVEVESGRRVALLAYHGFAEYAAAGRDAVVPLPPELDGQPFPGEALGCAVNVFRRSGVEAGQTVAVVGAGFLGTLLVQLCRSAGAHVLAFSRRESSRSLAGSFGAETPTDPTDESCDVAIEAAGAQETLDLAARLVRVRGRLVVAGYHQDGPRTVDMQLWNWRGLDVVNAHEREPQVYLDGIRTAARYVADGILDPAPLYTHVLPLARIEEALELARRRPEGFCKALVVTS